MDSNDFGAGTTGTVSESGGALNLKTAAGLGGTLAPAIGAISLGSFAAGVDGLTTVVQFGATSDPAWQGIVVSLLSNSGWFEVTGGLELHVFGSAAAMAGKPHQVALVGTSPVPGGGTKLKLLSAQDYDKTALADGFTVVLAVDPGGCRYRIDGLGAAPLVASGPWTAETKYAKNLDGENFVGVYIQGDPKDAVARQVEVQRLRVLRGRCTATGTSCVDGGEKLKAGNPATACSNCQSLAQQPSECCNYLAAACGNNPVCLQLSNCAGACPDAACAQGCKVTFSGGVDDYLALVACVGGDSDPLGSCGVACK